MKNVDILKDELGMNGLDEEPRRLGRFSLGMFNEVVGYYLWLKEPRGRG